MKCVVYKDLFYKTDELVPVLKNAYFLIHLIMVNVHVMVGEDYVRGLA